MSATVEELLLSAEYVLARGNRNVILCERGIRTFERYTRNTFDVNAIPLLKRLTHLPVLADPSHGARRRVGCPPASARVAERDHRLADGDGVVGMDRVEAGDAVDLEEGDVLGDVVAEHVRRVALPGATDLDAHAAGVLDDVVVGQDLTGRPDDHPGAGGLTLTAGQRRVDDGHRRVDRRFDGADVQAATRALGAGFRGGEADQTGADDECRERSEGARPSRRAGA